MLAVRTVMDMEGGEKQSGEKHAGLVSVNHLGFKTLARGVRLPLPAPRRLSSRAAPGDYIPPIFAPEQSEKFSSPRAARSSEEAAKSSEGGARKVPQPVLQPAVQPAHQQPTSSTSSTTSTTNQPPAMPPVLPKFVSNGALSRPPPPPSQPPPPPGRGWGRTACSQSAVAPPSAAQSTEEHGRISWGEQTSSSMLVRPASSIPTFVPGGAPDHSGPTVEETRRQLEEIFQELEPPQNPAGELPRAPAASEAFEPPMRTPPVREVPRSPPRTLDVAEHASASNNAAAGRGRRPPAPRPSVESMGSGAAEFLDEDKPFVPTYGRAWPPDHEYQQGEDYETQVGPLSSWLARGGRGVAEDFHDPALSYFANPLSKTLAGTARGGSVSANAKIRAALGHGRVEDKNALSHMAATNKETKHYDHNGRPIGAARTILDKTGKAELEAALSKHLACLKAAEEAGSPPPFSSSQQKVPPPDRAPPKDPTTSCPAEDGVLNKQAPPPFQNTAPVPGTSTQAPMNPETTKFLLPTIPRPKWAPGFSSQVVPSGPPPPSSLLPKFPPGMGGPRAAPPGCGPPPSAPPPPAQSSAPQSSSASSTDAGARCQPPAMPPPNLAPPPCPVPKPSSGTSEPRNPGGEGDAGDREESIEGECPPSETTESQTMNLLATAARSDLGRGAPPPAPPKSEPPPDPSVVSAAAQQRGDLAGSSGRGGGGAWGDSWTGGKEPQTWGMLGILDVVKMVNPDLNTLALGGVLGEVEGFLGEVDFRGHRWGAGGTYVGDIRGEVGFDDVGMF